jgi:hypothetical protein
MMAYGAGADYNFGHWAIRAEYEAYDTDKLDDLYVVSGSLHFLPRRRRPLRLSLLPHRHEADGSATGEMPGR